ncbi:MAG: DUF4139 domain-containing protein, partial [Planctomycetes bacterium]|nr:DUF4139 domain-containing protein [Planctomycetota bacterium]
ETQDVVVQSVEAKTVTGEALDNTQRDVLRAKLAQARAERRALNHDLVAITAEKGMLDAIIKAMGSGSNSAALLEQAAGIGEQAAALDRRLAVYEEESQVADALIRDMEHQLGDGGRKLRRFKEGRLLLWMERPGEATVRISYLISGASWSPTYDVRVSPDLTGVRVGLVAQVAQRTGEDWEDATVVLSTSTPSIGLDPPAVPVRVFTVPRMEVMDRPAAPSADSRLEALGAANDSAFWEEDSVEEMEESRRKFFAAPKVAVQDLGLTALFQLPEKKSLASDGELYRFQIREVPLEVRPERYVVPTASDKAFLRAEVTLGGDAPLLPGAAKIFLGPDFLGESNFPVLRPGDTTLIQLGLDPNLSIEWEKVVDKREDPGLLSSTATLTRYYRAVLKLSAHAPGDIEVLVEESIPISRMSSLEVTALDLRPFPLNDEKSLGLQESNGLYRWRVSLAPGQSQNIYWGYELDFNEKLQPVLHQE